MAGLITGILLATTPKVGDVAPAFAVTDTDGAHHTLEQMLKSGPVILAFFPKAFTGG